MKSALRHHTKPHPKSQRPGYAGLGAAVCRDAASARAKPARPLL